MKKQENAVSGHGVAGADPQLCKSPLLFFTTNTPFSFQPPDPTLGFKGAPPFLRAELTAHFGSL